MEDSIDSTVPPSTSGTQPSLHRPQILVLLTPNWNDDAALNREMRRLPRWKSLILCDNVRRAKYVAELISDQLELALVFDPSAESFLTNELKEIHKVRAIHIRR